MAKPFRPFSDSITRGVYACVFLTSLCFTRANYAIRLSQGLSAHHATRHHLSRLIRRYLRFVEGTH
jgi:hypothetical protein